MEPNSDVYANSHMLYSSQEAEPGLTQMPRDFEDSLFHLLILGMGEPSPGWDTPCSLSEHGKASWLGGAGNPRECSPVLPVCLPQLPLQGQTLIGEEAELGGGLLSGP